jgi:hypothetical protein
VASEPTKSLAEFLRDVGRDHDLQRRLFDTELSDVWTDKGIQGLLHAKGVRRLSEESQELFSKDRPPTLQEIQDALVREGEVEASQTFTTCWALVRI